jgi:hypothetical protein
MGYDINWSAPANSPILSTPQYQKWSQYTVAELVPLVADIKTAIKDARASRESASVINYLAWLVRTVNLMG